MRPFLAGGVIGLCIGISFTMFGAAAYIGLTDAELRSKCSNHFNVSQASCKEAIENVTNGLKNAPYPLLEAELNND